MRAARLAEKAAASRLAAARAAMARCWGSSGEVEIGEFGESRGIKAAGGRPAANGPAAAARWPCCIGASGAPWSGHAWCPESKSHAPPVWSYAPGPSVQLIFDVGKLAAPDTAEAPSLPLVWLAQLISGTSCWALSEDW